MDSVTGEEGAINKLMQEFLPSQGRMKPGKGNYLAGGRIGARGGSGGGWWSGGG